MDTLLDDLKQLMQCLEATCRILHRGTMNHDQQQQAQSVGHNVALTPGCLFMNIHATLLATFRSLHTLTINDSGAWLRIPSRFGTHLLDQPILDLFPLPLTFPSPKVAIDRSPGRKVGWQHSPLAAGAHHVQNGVNDLPHFPLAWTS